MKPDVPKYYANCKSPLLPRAVHGVGAAVGMEVACACVISAVAVPWLWARGALALLALAIFAYTFTAARQRGARTFPVCGHPFAASVDPPA